MSNRLPITDAEIQTMNREVLRMYRDYLVQCPCFIKSNMIHELTDSCHISDEDAFRLLFEASFAMDTEENAFHRSISTLYLQPSIHEQNPSDYTSNLYYKTITIPSVQDGQWAFCMQSYEPYEAFIYDDLTITEQNIQIPHLGFFRDSFSFPAVLQDNREWMFITPNEINTMQPVLDSISGNVITFGLGMGYFAFMASMKENVTSVTIIERDSTIIRLFETYILPQFPQKESIHIVASDAFDYVCSNMIHALNAYDHAFVDLWHDAADGVLLYLRMKDMAQQCQGTKFHYWVETTLKTYLD